MRRVIDETTHGPEHATDLYYTTALQCLVLVELLLEKVDFVLFTAPDTTPAEQGRPTTTTQACRPSGWSNVQRTKNKGITKPLAQSIFRRRLKICLNIRAAY